MSNYTKTNNWKTNNNMTINLRANAIGDHLEVRLSTDISPSHWKQKSKLSQRGDSLGTNNNAITSRVANQQMLGCYDGIQ
jgi:hypothetical protein